MSSKFKPKILVVNDDVRSLFALTSVIEPWANENECVVISAQSGEEALRHVLQDDFAVILLDVNMPRMDGFETAEAIHKRPRSSSIPIIFVTAYLADDLNRLKAYQQGAVDYLFTPIIPQVLQAKISVFVTLAKKNLELKAQTEILHQRTIDLESTNAKLQLEMNEKKLAIEQNKAKDEFLAMLGHELRNPLSAISSAVSIIEFPGAKEEVMNRAKMILSRQVQHLTRIVDDLLDLGRVITGKIVLNKKSVNLRDVLLACLENLRSNRPVNDYEWTMDIQDQWIEADLTRMEQIITNLLDNAIKYTPAGGFINLSCTVNNGAIALTIRDSGVGISADLLPRIFDIFVQGENSLDRAKGGMGIGLSLVKQLVELHDGHILAHSDGENCGSTFTLTFPNTTKQETTNSHTNASRINIGHNLLLIEDNKDAREVMAQLLEFHGFQILEASSGAEGIAIAQTQKPGIAIIDIGLPNMNGYEVARHLRAHEDTRSMHLIALTGYGLHEDKQLATEAGFNMHLIKPLDLDKLIRAIDALKTNALSSRISP